MNLIVNESMTMSSREIAELTGKRHDNVRADIQKMGEELSLIFQEKPEHSGGRPVMAYHLGKRECLILISGYSLELRARIIDRWQELERQRSLPAVPQSFAQALRLAAEQKAKLTTLGGAKWVRTKLDEQPDQ